MPVNVGGLGSDISFSDLQTFYGGAHPISLSEYYRGGAEVPSTAVSGNNPYTGTTSFSDSRSGSGGSNGISVTVSNQDTTSGGGTLGITQGFVAAQGIHTFSWTGAGTINLTVSASVGGTGRTADAGWLSSENVGVRNLSVTRRVTNRGRLEGRSRTFNSGSYTFQNSTRIGSGNTAPGGYDGEWTWTGTVSGSGQVALRAPGATTAVVRNSSTGASVTTPRRSFVFVNNTGQNISTTYTGAGSSSADTMSTRGETRTIGPINGSSEAWSYNYSYIDAGSGSGSADATVAGIVADVTTRQQTTTNPNASVAFASPSNSGNNISSITIPAGDVDFTMNIGVFSGNASAVFTESSFNTDGLSFAGGTPIRGSTHPRQIGPGRGGFFVFGTTPLTIRVTGTRASAVTWNSFASSGNGGVTERGSFSLTNNAQSTTTTVNDISFRNNTGSNIIFSSSSTGGARTLNNGATAQVQTGGSSTNWNFNYRYAPGTTPANTAIPTDTDPATPGPTIGLDQFNSPGNASP